MTRHLPHTRPLSRLPGQSIFAHALGYTLIFILASPMLLAWASPDEDTGSIMETTITEISTTEVSDRESRLRNMEDELLKQLSVGNTPSAQEGSPPSLADIKNVSDELAAAKNAPPTKQKNPIAPTANSALPKKSMDDAPANVPVVSYEEVNPSSSRSPQASSVVPVTAKSVAHRKPAARKSVSAEDLSAKDLEHRLAITEAQLNLLTQELESAKNKLVKSEAQVRDLTLQLEEESRPSASLPDTTSDRATRAAAVTIAEPGTQPSTNTEVARVTKNNSPLRIGPGPRESILTHLSRDNVVTIEHRTRGWYRIVTSDGARGWIAGNYLVFDTGLHSDSTIHVGAYEPQLDTIAARY